MNAIDGTPHPEFLGAYVMGLVDDDERRAIEAHLATCADCRHEVAELGGLRGVLDAVPRDAVLGDLAALDAADAAAGGGTDDLLLRRTLKELRAESTRSRRTRILGAAAGVVAIAALTGAGGLAIGLSGDDGTPPVTAQPSGRELTGRDDDTGVGLTARLTPANDTWTRLNVSVTGVEPGTLCQIVVVAKDGHRDVAGSWVVGTPTPGQPRRGVDGSTSVAPDDVAEIEIVDGEGERLVGLST